MANQIRYFLPHLLALSCSSPFWLGRKTGLMSNRCHIFKRFPRTGIPDEFESYEQLENFVKLLVRTGCIDNGKKIWWDVRAHYLYDTVEVRICDMPTRIEDTVALVALVQALMAKLYLMYKRNTAWRSYHRSLIEENKWRAVRYGTDAKMIDFGMICRAPLPRAGRRAGGVRRRDRRGLRDRPTSSSGSGPWPGKAPRRTGRSRSSSERRTAGRWWTG